VGDAANLKRGDPPMNDRQLLGVIEKIYEAATDPAGLDKLAGAVAHCLDTESGFISFGAFDAADKRTMALLLPHLQRALQIYSRLGFADREIEITRRILAGLAVGVVIATGDQKIVFANEAAERVLRDGRAVTVRQGRIAATDTRIAAQLQRHVMEAARTSAGDGLSAGGAMRIDLPSGSVLSVLVAPFRARGAGCGPELPAAVLIFREPDEAVENWEDALARVYQLTPAEARVLGAILGGSSLSDYADVAGISINTAKTHLRSIFRKTGHSRQADLVREIASDPVIAMLRKNGGSV
jgi:DNA-binding CsgD family transcriptional regulator